MNELAGQVEQAIRRGELLAPGMRVAVACSGGGDSVALLCLLDALKDSLGLRLLVVHLNHQLRGGEAEADEEFVGRLAAQLGLEFVARREEVAARARRERLNLEEAGRQARLEFFASLLNEGTADVVALAHTLDDQAETVLARLLRGAGTRGLAGIYPVVERPGGSRRGSLVRPLLGFPRGDLRAYLSEREQGWREDASNLDRSRLRSRLRFELLPQLTRLAGPSALEHLGRLAEQAREEESFWSAVTEEHFRQQVSQRGEEFELAVAALKKPLAALSSLPVRQAREAQRALARRLVRRTLAAVRGDLRRLTRTHVESVLRLAEAGQSGQRVELPGVGVERRFESLLFRAGATGQSEEAVAPPSYRLQVDQPGWVRLPDGGALHFKLVAVEQLESGYNHSKGAADAARAPFPLLVRSWLPGDRFQPVGAARRKKLKTLFQQERVARAERLRWPVVLSGGEIVWVPRFGVAAGHGLLPESRMALVIEERAGE
ncbi:MAG: tRNA lysidine(34) synthetase TilS [Candidatus Acidiferrales bacterium]